MGLCRRPHPAVPAGRRRGISRCSRGVSRGRRGAGRGVPKHWPPQAERGERSLAGPDGSGSGAAPREAGGRNGVGEGPAAPRQSPTPFPFGCWTWRAPPGSGERPCPSALRRCPPAAGPSSPPTAQGIGAGVGAAPPGRAGALEALACPKPVTRDAATLTPPGQTLAEV